MISAGSFLLVPLLALSDLLRFPDSFLLNGLLYRLENENYICDISYMYIRGSQKLHLFFFLVIMFYVYLRS